MQFSKQASGKQPMLEGQSQVEDPKENQEARKDGETN
jgi:hypothetical protein